MPDSGNGKETPMSIKEPEQATSVPERAVRTIVNGAVGFFILTPIALLLYFFLHEFVWALWFPRVPRDPLDSVFRHLWLGEDVRRS